MPARRFASLQDVIRQRQHASFVGRDAQIEQFRKNLQQPPDSRERRFIFNLHGVSGVGKTFLTRQLIRAANELNIATAYTNENMYDIPSVMGALASDLAEFKFELDGFAKKYSTYQRRRSELENDPNAPEGTPSFLTTTAIQIGLGAAGLVPIAGTLTSQLDSATIAEQADRLRKYISKKYRSHEIRLLLSPVEELTPAFVDGLQSAANRAGLALFFDSYEHTATLLDSWLIDVLNGRYGALPANIVVTIAGQKTLDANSWIQYLDVIADVQLSLFSDTEARQLLAHRGVTNSDVVEVILALSGGLPLLVAMLAENRPSDPAYLGDPTGNAIERFLKWEGDPQKRALALSAALARQLNKDVLAAIAGDEDKDALFEWIRKLPFVTDHAGRCIYHDIVRASMIRVLRIESPKGWLDQHRNLASRYGEWREALGLRDEAGWGDPVWVNYLLEETYHLLCSDANASLPEALSNAVHACNASNTVARRWAEMLKQAGVDTDSSGVEGWGDRLLLAMHDDYSYVTRYLSTLLEAAPLDDAIKSLALAERAEAHRLTKRYDDALVDFNDAVELNPKLTWAIASRGDTYRSMGRQRDAIADFNRAIEQIPTLAWAIAARGICWRSLGHLREALRNFDAAIELDANYAWALANRAETYRLSKAFKAALSDFDRATKLDPDYAWAIASRGRVYYEMHRYEEALIDFNRAVRIDHKLIWAYTARARTYNALARFDDAIADFDHVIHASPNNASAIYHRGRTHYKKRSYEEALGDFDRAIELEPDLDFIFAARAWTLLDLGRFQEALNDFDEQLKREPTFEPAAEGRERAVQALTRMTQTQ
jgi:tetratricopeptide (TPR) repeat protein